MLDKLLPQLLVIEEENKKSINISLCNDIERAGFNITRIINIEKILNYFFHEPLAIIVTNAELQENPMVTVSNQDLRYVIANMLKTFIIKLCFYSRSLYKTP